MEKSSDIAARINWNTIKISDILEVGAGDPRHPSYQDWQLLQEAYAAEAGSSTPSTVPATDEGTTEAPVATPETSQT
jgi:hypothetical protein